MLKVKLFNSQTGDFQETALTPQTMPQSECLIGRASTCNLILDSLEVSRVHGKVKFQEGEYYYIDMGSANGSHVNNEPARANQNYCLKVNDSIRVGDFMLLVEALETSVSTGETSLWKKLRGDRQWTKGDLNVRCMRVTDETSDVKTFTFVAEPPVLFNYKPGQFVTLELEINGEQILRSYSISSSPSRPHALEITVKRVPPPSDASDAPPGLVSNWLHDNITVGSRVKLNGPMGKFTCLPNLAPKLLMISAGSGITPMMSMSRWIADTATTSDVIFFHCARTSRDIIFRQELEMMAARLPNFRLCISTTRSELGQPWLGFTGRLTETILQNAAPDFRERTVYVCGPDSFMQGVKTMLEGLDFPMQNYHEESFGGARKAKKRELFLGSNGTEEAQELPQKPSLFSASASPSILFAQSNKEVSYDQAESILEVAEQEGIKIRSNCKQGVCGACKKRKLEGEVKYESEPDALDQSEQEAGYILTCVASPVGRVVIEA
ncbi:MAG: FHA domain-containing protein [Leptolyngbyaceae cyanobacterium SM1_4_3]|nr:FHA domain-containing protein [Leptolyngbyaceae cyanobacterium SM1_4_3]NJN89457.1 FHA domain-containing protein [Leptolyngbyaceae cyanobacterium SL_5_14]NJO66332.1 FHA domain-containing protein [Leptolyngbyaceae cyanobacterium RM1_405_57]